MSLIILFHLESTSWSVLRSVAVSFSLGPLISVGVVPCSHWLVSLRFVPNAGYGAYRYAFLPSLIFLYVLPPVADHEGFMD